MYVRRQRRTIEVNLDGIIHQRVLVSLDGGQTWVLAEKEEAERNRIRQKDHAVRNFGSPWRSTAYWKAKQADTGDGVKMQGGVIIESGPQCQVRSPLVDLGPKVEPILPEEFKKVAIPPRPVCHCCRYRIEGKVKKGGTCESCYKDCRSLKGCLYRRLDAGVTI